MRIWIDNGGTKGRGESWESYFLTYVNIIQTIGDQVMWRAAGERGGAGGAQALV